MNIVRVVLVALIASIVTAGLMFAATGLIPTQPSAQSPTATSTEPAPFVTRTAIPNTTPTATLPPDDLEAPVAEGLPTSTLSPQVRLDAGPDDGAVPEWITELPEAVIAPEVALEVDLHYDAQWARVRQRIGFRNAARASWTEVVFATNIAVKEGAFQLDAASVDGVPVTPTLAGTMLHVPMPKAIGPSRGAMITLEYRIAVSGVYEDSSFPEGNNGISGDVMRLGEWFPVMVPYDNGIGWRTWDYKAVGDPIVYPVQNVTLAVRADPDVVVVSSGFQQRDGDVWRFRTVAARGVPIFASRDFNVVNWQSADIPIQSFYLGDDSTAAQRAAEWAADALVLYEELYGEYPYNSLVIVQNGYHGDMEFSGLVSISSRSYGLVSGEPTSLLLVLLAHEVAHQWWYGGVGNDQVREPWLDESLASYSELMYFDRYVRGGSARRLDVYVRRARPMTLDVGIYDFIDSHEYVEGLYPRGVMFIRELHALVGNDAFFAFIKTYYAQFRGRLATTEDFFTILRQYSSADIKPLLQQYFANPNR